MAPTFRHGKSTVIHASTIGSTVGSIRLSSGFNDSSLMRAIDKAETSVYGDQTKRYLVGLADASFKLSGNYSSTHEKLLTRMLGNSTGLYISYSPESTTAGRRRFKFPAVITQMDIKSPISDKVAMEMTMQVAGAIVSTNW